jgi:hypothetical protein
MARPLSQAGGPVVGGMGASVSSAPTYDQLEVDLFRTRIHAPHRCEARIPEPGGSACISKNYASRIPVVLIARVQVLPAMALPP